MTPVQVKSITVKGRVAIREDAETKAWFYPAFSDHLRPGDPEGSQAFQTMLDSPLRVVLEIVPEKFITYDGAKMMAHTAGTLDESELGADDVVFDNTSKRGVEIEITQESTIEKQSAEKWMRTVDTDTRDFLRSRFALEAAREGP